MTKEQFWKQRVNFFVSVAFIAAFGIWMTTLVVHAIRTSAPIIFGATSARIASAD
jgi:hypothetical protein